MVLFPRVNYEKNNGSKPKMIFLAGFPDNQTSGWGKVLPEQLSESYDLFFLCLPGYEKGGKIPQWGYDFNQLMESLHLTIVDITKGDKYVLVCHDWGAFLGLLYQTRYPNHNKAMQKLVLFDIGILTPFTVSLKSLFIITLYQVWFCWSFILAQLLGQMVGTIFMGLFFIPIFKPLWPSYDRPPAPRREIHANKCYPYLYLWRDLLLLNQPKLTFPEVPTFYMYGTQKNCMFHDQEWIDKLNSRKECFQKSVDAGHWLMVTKGDEVMQHLKPWLQAK